MRSYSTVIKLATVQTMTQKPAQPNQIISKIELVILLIRNQATAEAKITTNCDENWTVTHRDNQVDNIPV